MSKAGSIVYLPHVGCDSNRTVQALCGGQPLLIVGVAEPIVLMYGYMYSFMQGRLSTSLFLEWSAWVCVWTAVLLLLLSVVGSCRYIVRFTRFSGELFGFLIAMLFIQQFVRGDVESFHPLEADADHGCVHWSAQVAPLYHVHPSAIDMQRFLSC